MSQQGDIFYNRSDYTKKEWTLHILWGIAYYFIMGMIFFNHLMFAGIACLGVYFHIKEQKSLSVKKRKYILREQFREAMYTLSSSLSAGRSAEQAFIQTLADLRILYDHQTDIITEWSLIVKKLNMNETIESALEDFAMRAGVEDIHNFTGVFIMAKRTGGDLIRIIRETTHMINEKIEIQKEIDLLVVQKQFEQKILSYIIPGMILFFQLTSPDFLSPLYETFIGRLVMVFALFLYLLSRKIGEKIVTIEV
ncbi:type II secretion system F family protein [Petrocella sp. FN5]|uniref:type II secretion system F family protein n=1 Tax=Petrocella sp. FN5 TaxID=3032002 RepID=UPI0023DA54C9|nr:pilus assembly protein TadB [Petrocella sp. FN5]MDF1617095.1 pilus assembly protein TadB [Petrocella sp. FN5]